MKIKTKKTRSVAAGSTKRSPKRPDPIESFKQKLEKEIADSAYLDAVDELDDNQIKATIDATMSIPVANEKGNGAKVGKMVADSATGTMTQAPSVEFNGPIPLGFRAVPPSHLLGLKGPMGILAQETSSLAIRSTPGLTRIALSTRRTACRARMLFPPDTTSPRWARRTRSSYRNSS